MYRSRWIWTVVSLLLAMAVLAGCGDDQPVEVAELRDISERPSTTRPPPATETDSTSTSTSTSQPEPSVDPDDEPRGTELCVAFQSVSDLDDAFEAEINDLLAPVLTAAESGDRVAAQQAADAMAVEMQGILADALPGLLGAYDHLAEVAPHLADDVVILRDFTDELGRAMAGAGGSIVELNRAMEEIAQSGAMAAANATLRLDEVSRANCGIIIAD